jgi:transposase
MISIMKLRVAYAKSRYKETVYITPLIVTSYRDEKGVSRNKTIVSLAKLPEFIVTLIDKALKKGDDSVLEDYVHFDEVKYLQSLVVGPVFVVWTLLKQLGLYRAILSLLSFKQACAIFSIIVERVVSPKPLSVMAQQRQFRNEPLSYLLDVEKSPSLNTWYAALAQLEEQRETILQMLFAQNHTPGDVYLYDITSSYFEGDTCPLGEYGYNRDGKKGKKQVVIGVICDAAGCPIWVDVFKGNTADQTTVKQQLLTLKEKLGVQNFVFVGDRGMVTHARIEELETEGWWDSFRYITALTRRQMMRLVEDSSHPIQMELFDHHNLVEVEENGIRYVLCHNPNRREQDGKTRDRFLSLTEEKLKAIQKSVGQGRVKKKEVIARRLHRWINRWHVEHFFTVNYDEGFFSFSRKEEEIERYARLDGCYVIRSNQKKERQNTEELVARYKDLKYVEQAFRTMKTTDINTRPIRHFNEPQVRGHIFACFLAYRIIWELRQRWAPVLQRDPDTKRCEAGSLLEIWRELGSITLAKVAVKEKIYFQLSKVGSRAQKLLTMAKIPGLQTFLSE